MTDDRLIPFGLGFLGIGLVCLAMFLPYVDESSVASFSRVAENTMLQASYGWVTLIFAGFCAISLIRNWQAPRRVIWPLLSGILVGGSAIYNAVDEESRTLCPLTATSVTDACQVGSPGMGIYVLGIGGAALVGSGLFMLRYPEAEPKTAAGPAGDPMKVTRECPHCKTNIRPDATVCPHCQRESKPWLLKESVWWRQDENGAWLWFDATPHHSAWRPYEGASVTDEVPRSASY